MLERAEKGSGRRVVSMDAGIAFTEVADQKRATEDAEADGSESATPWRTECSIVDAESQVVHAIGIEATHEAVTNAFFIEAGHRVHFGIHDVQRAADRLDVERVISVAHLRRNSRVDEWETGGRLEGEAGVVNVDRAIGEVGGVKMIGAVVGDREAGVDVARVTSCDDA